MKKLFFLLAIATCFVSCQETDTYETIKVKNYSLDIPSHLSEVNNLNENASLQYQNAFKELYIIVIDETKTDVRYAMAMNGFGNIYSNDFDGYVKLMSENFNKAIPTTNRSQKDTIINSFNAKIINFNGKVQGYDVFYKMAYVDGVDNYYQIMSWTLLSKKLDHEKAMDKMLHSFRVKNKKKYIKPVVKK